MTTETLPWFRVALQLQGSVAPIVFPRVLLCSGFGFLVSLIYYFKVPLSWEIFGSVTTNVVFNLVLGLLLVFRTNTAYERFWEGRKTWGVLVVNVRNLARQILVGIAETDSTDREQKAAILRLLVAFSVATKLHLRKEALNNELDCFINPEQGLMLNSVKNPPLQVALWIGNYLQQQQQRNCLKSEQLIAMNSLLDSMVEALTGCERILNTPIPLAYAIYLKRLLLIYGFLLPFQLVNELQWWTALVVALISFVLFGIEQIGIEIENPFGYDPNDLPLDEICNTILQNTEDLIKGHNSELGLTLPNPSVSS